IRGRVREAGAAAALPGALAHGLGERMPLGRTCPRHTRGSEDRGGEVDEPDSARHARRGARSLRRSDDERDVQRALIQEETVRALAVLAEALTVVGGHDEERAVEDPRAAQPLQKLADLAVDGRDLTIVG